MIPTWSCSGSAGPFESRTGGDRLVVRGKFSLDVTLDARFELIEAAVEFLVRGQELAQLQGIPVGLRSLRNLEQADQALACGTRTQECPTLRAGVGQNLSRACLPRAAISCGLPPQRVQ